MDSPGNPLREAMGTLAHEALKSGGHPSTSRLLAYHRGEIPAAEMPAIREHLSLCGECAAVVLDAADFFAEDEEDEEDEEDAPADLAAAWEEIQAATGRGKTLSPAPEIAPLLPVRRPLLRSLGFAYSLAATFAALAIGLLVFRGASAPTAPQVNAGLYDLTSVNAERSGGAEPKTIRFQSPEDMAFLILNPEVVSHASRHGVRIRNADGAVAWRTEDLVPQETGAFHLTLPAGALPGGRYSLELYGVTGDRETLLGTYPIAIGK